MKYKSLGKITLSRFITHFLILIAFMLPSFAAAADLYVQSVKAPILSSPSLGSPKLAEAAKGESLKEMEKKGDWYKVGYKDVSGWVSRLLVGPRPPAGKISVLEETEERIEKGARKRASAFTTAAAARGLAEERARLSDKLKVDYNGVEMMEAIRITDEEASRFIQEGVGR